MIDPASYRPAEVGAPTGQASVSMGRIVGRFTFTSRGSDGWGISSQSGEILPDVTREATSYIERLDSPPEPWGQIPEVADRARRYVWAGTRGGRWRYLLNTYAAGSDHSNRPGNNFTDVLVVQRTDRTPGIPGPPAVRPSLLWDSPDWLSPYGPTQVAGADVAHLANALAPAVPDGPEPLLAFAEHSVNQHTGEYFTNLAQLIWVIAESAHRPRAVCVPSPELGQLYLDAALSVCPVDVIWDTTFEIRSAPGTSSALALSLFPGDEQAAAAAGAAWLGDGRSVPPFAAYACPLCGRPRARWQDVAGTLLLALGVGASSDQPDWCHTQASHLLRVSQMLAAAGASSPDYYQWFNRNQLSRMGAGELASQFAGLAQAVNTDHRLCDSPPMAPAPRGPQGRSLRPNVTSGERGRPSRAAALDSSGPAGVPAYRVTDQPPPRASAAGGRAARRSAGPRVGAPSPVALQAALEYLASARPTARTSALARCLADHLGSAAGQESVLATHIAMSSETTARRVFEAVPAQMATAEQLPSRLLALCADEFASWGVMSLAGVAESHASLAGTRNIENAVLHASLLGERAAWPETLLLPLVCEQFVARWLDRDDHSVLGEPIRADRTQPVTLGMWLLGAAVTHATSRTATGRDPLMRLSIALTSHTGGPQAAAPQTGEALALARGVADHLNGQPAGAPDA